jgi:hypothetical protein
MLLTCCQTWYHTTLVHVTFLAEDEIKHVETPRLLCAELSYMFSYFLEMTSYQTMQCDHCFNAAVTY